MKFLESFIIQTLGANVNAVHYLRGYVFILYFELAKPFSLQLAIDILQAVLVGIRTLNNLGMNQGIDSSFGFRNESSLEGDPVRN
jgi:hypothetical protein